MLKQRDLQECQSLYHLMIDPAVFPYVRNKSQSYEEYLFTTERLIVEEEQGTSISRTILNETGHPIGTIDLYDIGNKTGFLATWVGIPYFGKGYNQRAKETFFSELFLKHNIETVFLKIREQNIRSKKAVQKLPYVKLANDINPPLYHLINYTQQHYDLYQVDRLDFLDTRNVVQAY
ncbi:GNAT family N-acetyltransferase [Paenibacillus radicis (ex Gao et al. 2016)]|uniref:Alanine acetyltransferase n=1 Tax=Paenibacillus radicis (ex Gao et al. 2016) TaxID=1737354 RepID=A0A917H7L9_9BACL|nr:GNAT family protein [Paenibacillus radicis (ex Gao et al. 2016)]GGG69155.1 alanine acetyltransferase [Paenibacillus radicis (ex Gao et al. 2016)]